MTMDFNTWLLQFACRSDQGWMGKPSFIIMCWHLRNVLCFTSFFLRTLKYFRLICCQVETHVIRFTSGSSKLLFQHSKYQNIILTSRRNKNRFTPEFLADKFDWNWNQCSFNLIIFPCTIFLMLPNVIYQSWQWFWWNVYNLLRILQVPS